jgi:CRP-like cAMP-binding protein/membrane protein YdbS with pleckstrin-like domain
MSDPTMVQRLEQLWLFQGLPHGELARTQGFFQPREVGAGEQLFVQGDVATHFYLVESGAVVQTGRDEGGREVLQRKVEAGEFLGHRALLAGRARQTTAFVPRQAELLEVSADDFHTLLALLPEVRHRLEGRHIVNRLLAIPLFRSFDQEALFRIADLVRIVEFPKGQTIFVKGELPAAFYVVDIGQVMEDPAGGAPGQESWPKYFTAGNFFGRYALLHNTVRRATARATTDVRLFRLEDEAFDWLVNRYPAFRAAVTDRPDMLKYLQHGHVFSRLTESELKELAGYVGLARLRRGDVLYRQGDIDPTLYVLYDGEAVAHQRDEAGKERPVGYLQATAEVGEASVFLREPRDVTAEATTDSCWCYLTREDLDLFLTKNPKAEDRVIPKQEVRARRRLPRLEWMDPGEQMVLQRRRHWFVLFMRLIPPVILLLLSLAVDLFSLWGGALVQGLATVVTIAAILWTLWRLIDWLNDYYYVTTKRVAHREKTLLIRERRTEAPLDKVQNVAIEQGLIGNALGFGELTVETASAARVSRPVFTYVGDPEGVQAVIFEQMRRLRAGELLEGRRMIRSRLEERVDLGVSPQIPRPVIPSERPSGEEGPPRPSWWRRFVGATVGEMFWIEKREDGQVIWRKHWLKLLQAIILPLLASVGTIPLLLITGLVALGGSPLGLGLLLLVGAAPLAWLWWNWVNWGNDLYIVTDDRIIDTERLPLGFRSSRTETTFDKVQNVNFLVPGPLATIFDFGTVTIYTAGVEGTLDFSWVKGPARVQAEIFSRLGAYEERQRRQRRQEQWELMPEWFALYEETRRS